MEPRQEAHRGNVWIPRPLCELSVEIAVLLWMLDDAFVGCRRGQP